MPYDPQLDNCVFSKTWEGELDKLTVCVYSYNSGPKKLQITRSSKDKQGEFRFSKLGRMTKQEVEAILPYIQEAMQYLS
ncbi:MAG: hypothetical protein NC924_08900 [Candidatus Omnitrophica bacterium]|nr:hypothetical protein [Candidatus Omnitrophota bacterium]